MTALTKVDWLTFRSKAGQYSTLEAIQRAYGEKGGLVKAKPRGSGWMGYTHSVDLLLDSMHLGLMAYGGDHQKGWVTVNLTGRGCEWIPDWDEAQSALMTCSAYEPRRVDIALDTFKREVTHESVLEAYRGGLFTTSGRPPKMSQILPDDAYDGRTIYVGKRDQGKFLRAYEKGYEMVRMFPNIRVSFVNDVPIADLYRLELELKAKNVPLPLDVIDSRDQYFAGAYPYLQQVLDVEPEIFRQSKERGPQRDMEAVLENIRHQYGSALFTALTVHGGDVGKVWEKIVGNRHHDGLLEKGVLLVEHE